MKIFRNAKLRSRISLGHRLKKTLLASRGGHRALRNTKHVLYLSAVTDEEGHPLENEDESGRRFSEFWRTIFQARQEGPRHHQHEDFLRHVQQAPEDIGWPIDQSEFDDLLVLKKNSAPNTDGIPYGKYRCAKGLGLKFFLDAYRALLEGSAVPDSFDESRTVFSPRPLTSMKMGGLFNHQSLFAR